MKDNRWKRDRYRLQKLLLKYHKTINKKGELPTRLIIPAMNFTATFLNIGYPGIKRCLDKGKVNYSRDYIVQSPDLKKTAK